MKNKFSVILFALILTIAGCIKETTTPTDNTVAGGPTVTTAEAQSITTTSAVLGGNVIAEGSCTVLTSGVVFSTAHNPTTNDVLLPNPNTGTGSFSVSATGLLPATTYYARAFAANCKGINYGNEIHFTTLGGTGGGGQDTTYYLQLTFKGVTYVCAGVGSDSIVEADGNRAATCAVYGGIFVIAGASSHYIDDSKSNGFSFGATCLGITGIGTYSFNDLTADPKSFNMGVRVAPGPSSAVLPTTTIVYNNSLNEERHHDISGNCISTAITIATQTLHITQWGNNPNDVVEGTFSGTIYENGKTAYDCTNSEAQSFTGSFKLKRSM